MEKITIAENKYYIIQILPEKNRAYLKILGFWRSPEVVPNYLADWKKAASKLNKGLTLLTDASEMKTHPQSIRSLHEEAQGIILSMDVRKVAEVVSDEVAEMQLDSVAKITKFPKKNFSNAEAAEQWLDEVD